MTQHPLNMKIKGIIRALLCLAVILLIMPTTATFAADDRPETIRVGFFAFDGYHEIDEKGRKSGYGYDFLTLMKRYADVNYEYIGYDKSWNDMQRMLLNGEIDMLTAAHKTPERESLFDYSLPIGTTSVKLNVRDDEKRYIEGDYSTYNGMTIGLMTGDVSCHKMEVFAKENHFSFVAKYYDNSAALSEALALRQVDGIAESSLCKTGNEKTIAEFGTPLCQGSCHGALKVID